MALGYAEGSIAGAALQNAGGDKFKALILDGANVTSARAINNRTAASGNLYTQTLTLTVGIPFGVLFEYVDTSVLQDIIAAIQTAVDAQATFNVTLTDDLQTIDLDAVPDGSRWLSYDKQRTNPNVVKGVTMRFLTA